MLALRALTAFLVADDTHWTPAHIDIFPDESTDTQGLKDELEEDFDEPDELEEDFAILWC